MNIITIHCVEDFQMKNIPLLFFLTVAIYISSLSASENLIDIYNTPNYEIATELNFYPYRLSASQHMHLYPQDLLIKAVLKDNNPTLHSPEFRIFGKGTFVQNAGISTNTLIFAVYIVREKENYVVMPVTRVETDGGLAMLVPGLDSIIRKSVTIGDFTTLVTLRKSEEDGPFQLVSRHGRRGIRPVPRPDNEETAELRGTVEVGTTMEAAFRRLEAFKKGEMRHPPAGSSWTHLWQVGDGLLAIERNGETDEVSKLAYIQWPESESPMTLELSRIYLTDGEMVMPIPPPPVPIPTPTPPTPNPFEWRFD